MQVVHFRGFNFRDCHLNERVALATIHAIPLSDDVITIVSVCMPMARRVQG